MTLLNFLGDLALVGFIVDLVTKYKTNKEKLNKIQCKLDSYESQLKELSNEAENHQTILNVKTSELLSDIDNYQALTDITIECCDNLILSIEKISKKIDILAEVFNNDTMTDIEKNNYAKEYIELIQQDIQANIRLKTPQKRNYNKGLGYER